MLKNIVIKNHVFFTINNFYETYFRKKENDYLVKKTKEALRAPDYKIIYTSKKGKVSHYLRRLAFKNEVNDLFK